MIHLRPYQLGYRIAVSVLLVLVPIVFPTIYIHLSTEILIYMLFATSFNLLLGYGRILAFGHGGLFGVGAYCTALVLKHIPNMHIILGLPIIALCGAVAGIIIGFFVIRLKGAYGALLSFSLQMFLFAVAWKWRPVTGGDDGMGVTRPELLLPALGSVSLQSIDNLYYFTLIIVSIGIFACYLFLKTPLGNSYICMREKDTRASFLGYNVFLTRLAVFSFSSFLASLAGGLFVIFQECVSTSCIDMNISLSVMIMTVIGGPDHFLGPLLGTLFYVVFQDWVSSFTTHWWIFLGIVFILVVLYFEGGLISVFKNERIRLWGSRLAKGTFK